MKKEEGLGTARETSKGAQMDNYTRSERGTRNSRGWSKQSKAERQRTAKGDDNEWPMAGTAEEIETNSQRLTAEEMRKETALSSTAKGERVINSQRTGQHIAGGDKTIKLKGIRSRERKKGDPLQITCRSIGAESV